MNAAMRQYRMVCCCLVIFLFVMPQVAFSKEDDPDGWGITRARTVAKRGHKEWLLFTGGNRRLAFWSVSPVDTEEITRVEFPLILAEYLRLRLRLKEVVLDASVADIFAMKDPEFYFQWPESHTGKLDNLNAAGVLEEFVQQINSQSGFDVSFQLLPPLGREMCADHYMAAVYVRDPPVISIARKPEEKRLEALISFANGFKLVFFQVPEWRAKFYDNEGRALDFLSDSATSSELCSLLEACFRRMGNYGLIDSTEAKIREIGTTGVLLISFDEPVALDAFWDGFNFMRHLDRALENNPDLFESP